jgi:hypothetical protein
MMVNDPVCKRKTAETTDAPVKPTEGPKSCDCGYSKEDFNALKAMVERHDRALQDSSMEINDVLTGVSDMRSCISKMKLPGDMPYESTKKPFESTKKPYESTKMPYETTRRDYPVTTRREYPETTRRDYPETTRREMPETTRMERPETTRMERPETTRREHPETTRMDRPETTRKERPETTRMERPETTRMERPETTRMERPETTRMERPETTRKERPETTKFDYETTMERIRTTMDVKPTRPEMPETTRPERTETTADVDVIEPTEAWERFGRLDSTGYKCGMGGARAFKIGYASLEGCLQRCAQDTRCNYATTEMKSHCIGCKDKPNVPGNGWFSYETFGPRRQLSQTEALKVEAASLRAELAKVRGF